MTPPYDHEADPFGLSAPDRRLGARRPDPSRGAENLLVKAADAWAAGDDERARSFLDRAAARPYDGFERCWPGLAGADGLLLELLAHTIETGDRRAWFAAVEATFATVAGAQQVTALARALASTMDEWDIAGDLSRDLRTVTARTVVGAGQDHDPALDAAVVRSRTEATLRVAVRLAEELGTRGLCSHLRPEHW